MKVMSPTLLTKFQLSIDINTFYDVFWMDTQWFERFLCDYLEDLSVNVSEWKSTNDNTKTRNIRSLHPSKVSFPGLPSHAESLKTQIITFSKVNKDDNKKYESKIIMKESNTFRGIPYADYFSVNTEWLITSNINRPNECFVIINLDLIFHKSTWLQGTIESNTKAELVTVYEKWLECASKQIKQLQSHKQITTNKHSITIKPIDNDINEYRDPNNDLFITIDENKGLANLINYVSTVALTTDNDDDDKSSDSFPSDEELLFYDCEEGIERTLTNRSSRTTNQRNLSTPTDLKDIYKSNQLLDNTIDSSNQLGSRDIAVNVVESIIVLAQYSYWKCHRLYMYDLKELFNVNPSDVISRIINSFLPSLHSPILLKPDIYGPLLAVFMLPQALLLSMDTSRHGCSQNSVLGNAVIVSICLWGGLSSLYRLLSFVIAPTIGIKHCLSMTGYSFFGWTLALLCSYPLERYNQQIGLPIALPIVLFGVPSAIALGYMFWEQTPASSLTIQPASFPTSLQNFAHNNSRILQKLLWAVPKIIAFILVSGTHYQFLWYVARVFLPGKQQQCELSALIQPAQYADIITQKELRKYALILLNGGTN